MTMVTFAPFEEEIGAQIPFVGKIEEYCSRDYRLASARYTFQPEYAFTSYTASSYIYLLSELKLSPLVASSLCSLVWVSKAALLADRSLRTIS